MIDPWLLGFVCAVLVVVIGAAFLPRRAKTLRDRAARTAAKVGLALTEEVEPRIVRRQVRERRLSLVLGAITWTGAFGVVNVIQWDRFDVSSIWFTNGAMVVGGAIGSAAAAIISSRRKVAVDTPRLARSRSVTFADYIPRAESLASRATVAIALAVLAASVLVGTISMLTAALIGGLCVASLVLFELVGRWIVRQRQQASTMTELAWDDALRSIDLKAIELAPFATALYALVGTMFGVTELRGPVHLVGDAGLVALVIGMIVLAILRASRSLDRDRYFLRRLWPQTAAEADANERAAMGVQL